MIKAMLGAVGLGRPKEAKFDMTATLKSPIRAEKLHAVLAEDPEKLIGKESLNAVNIAINSLITHTLSWVLSIIAQPKVEYIPSLYAMLLVHEFERERRIKENLPERRKIGRRWQKEDWGWYTLGAGTVETDETSFKNFSLHGVSVSALDDVPDKKLVYTIEMVVRKSRTTAEIADIRYLLYLEKNLEKVPDVLKNGKWNVFAGTVVSANAVRYTVVAMWTGSNFEKKLVRLDEKFMSLAQVVNVPKMILQ